MADGLYDPDGLDDPYVVESKDGWCTQPADLEQGALCLFPNRYWLEPEADGSIYLRSYPAYVYSYLPVVLELLDLRQEQLFTLFHTFCGNAVDARQRISPQLAAAFLELPTATKAAVSLGYLERCCEVESIVPPGEWFGSALHLYR